MLDKYMQYGNSIKTDLEDRTISLISRLLSIQHCFTYIVSFAFLCLTVQLAIYIRIIFNFLVC